MRQPLMAVLVVAFYFAAASVPAAQTRIVRYGDDRLAGITELDIVVQVDAASAICLAARQALQQSAAAAFRAADIRATVSERASSWHYTAVVSVQSAEAGDACVTSLSTELIAQVEGFPEADKYAAPERWGSILIGAMTLVRENELVISALATHDAAVQAAVRMQAAALAERIRRANP